jgi:hypothetical protein
MEKCILKGINGNLSCIFLPFEKNKKLFEENKEAIIRNIIITLSLSNQNCENIYENLIERKLYIYNNDNNSNNNYNNINILNRNVNKREFSMKEKNKIKNNSSKNATPTKEQNKINIVNNLNDLPVSFTFKKKRKKIFCCGCL